VSSRTYNKKETCLRILKWNVPERTGR